MSEKNREISLILKDWSGGKRESANVLPALAYEELRRFARRYLRRERSVKREWYDG